MKKRIIALLMAGIMALGCGSALAENTKHERVFVVAGADGTVKSVTDNIRLENADGLDEIADMTLLSDIQNVSGKEAFTLDGETVAWQAQGKDITYQGTSDKTPAILPVVKLTLDGEEITAEALKDKTGEAVLTVTYQNGESLPALAVTVLPLPDGVSDLKLENAAVLNEMGQQVLVGWAVPGVDAELDLPDSFTAYFHADHADFAWMMTLTTSDPIDAVCKELDGRIDIDPHAELDEAKALLIALQNGDDLPETTGKTRDIAPKINELNDGLTQLNDGATALAEGAKTLSEGASDLKDGAAKLDKGAQSLADGASALKEGAAQADEGAQALSDALTQLSGGASQLNDGAAALAAGAKTLADGTADAEDGAASLDAGLAALIENNEALNNGAAALFTAVLNTANQQLSAAGLDAAGITMPELTAENYVEVLDAVLAQLNPETLQETAYAQVEAAVRTQVEANKDQVRAAVEAAVQNEVLEAVLQAVGQNLTAEQYSQAVQAGQIPEDLSAQIDAVVEKQMAAEAIQEQIEAALQAQIEQLVQQQIGRASCRERV